MKPTYEFRHIDDLPPNLQAELLDVIGNRHLPESQWRPFGLSNGCVPVALIRKGSITPTRTEAGTPAVTWDTKVLAAIVTDGRQRVHWWAGRIDREFLAEHKVTPAAALLGEFLARIGRRSPTFKAPLSAHEGNLLENRNTEKDPINLVLTGDEKTGTYAAGISEKRRRGLKKDIPAVGNTWRKYNPYK